METASVICRGVLPTLLCVWLVALLSTAEQLRADAEQENFETLALVPGMNDPRSTLFANCLSNGRTVEAKMASIQLVGSTNEWVRNVPDNTTRQLSITWTDPPNSTVIASIVDCAAAADAGGKKMFKYGEGTVCKLSDVAYNFTAAQKCEDSETDAVFSLPPP